MCGISGTDGPTHADGKYFAGSGIDRAASAARKGRDPRRDIPAAGAPPERIDKRTTHRADSCPDCGSRLKRWVETRTRYAEHIPEKIEPAVTEHTIHRD